MAVKMRLMRMGKKRSSHYRVVVIDGRAPRDGRYIEQVGRYDPNQDPSLIEIDNEKAVGWLLKGVQPTDSVRKLLEISGAMSKFKVASGQIHTVSPKAKAAAAEAASTMAPAEPPPTPPVAGEPAPAEPATTPAAEQAAAEASPAESPPAGAADEPATAREEA